MNLFEFITSSTFRVSRNGYVDEQGFTMLYVRTTRRSFKGERVPTLDIANVSVCLPGQGTFTRLIEEIQINFPNLWIYVENVYNISFRHRLLKLGFIQERSMTTTVPSFYLEPLTMKTPSIQELTYHADS